MKKLLSVIVAASLLLYPFAAYAQDYGSQTAETQQVPPVAQTLVREGDFAIKLVATLGLGSTTDEALAEDALAKAGVAPANGWLSDYPMTPQIIGQIQDSIVKAATDGNLNMTAEQAQSGFNALISQMNLPAPAGSEQAAGGPNALPGQPDQTEINNYYYDQGPPVITYYPPPPYYGYLYDWVPYPVFWFGFWFPGFYICHNFTTVVVVNHRPCIVSNHVIDPRTGRVAVVAPATRTRTGSVRSGTTLQTQSGRTFGNLADLRNGVSPTRPNAGRTGTFASSTLRSGGFKSAEARRSAGVIYSRMSERMRLGAVTGGGSGAGGERPFIAPNVRGRSYQGPVRGGERRFIAPSGSGRSYRSPLVQQRTEAVRPFYAPRTSSMSGIRQFSGPTAPSRSFGGSVSRGGHSSTGSFPRGGYGR